eukprot:jgi/Galph1/161/GphlegSOOS_G4918.1
MAPVTPLFGTSPRTTNREVEHWMSNLNEVQSVINTVEPKLTAAPTKWKNVSQHVKEVSDELSQIFNKEDPHYDVIIAGVNAARKFDTAQSEAAKNDSVRERAQIRLRKYRDEIETLRREYKEREKVRERYDHYRVKLDNLEKKGKDQPRIERNQQKLKDAEDAYHAVTAELIQKMEICWKKHVEIFAEASIALWHTQLRMVDELAQSSEGIRPYIEEYLNNMRNNTSNVSRDYTQEGSAGRNERKDVESWNDRDSEEAKNGESRLIDDPKKRASAISDTSSPVLEENGKQLSTSEAYRSARSTRA